MSVLKIVLLQQYHFRKSDFQNEMRNADCLSSSPNVLYERLRLARKSIIYGLLEIDYYDNLPEIAVYLFRTSHQDCHGKLIHKINMIKPFLVIGYEDYFTKFINYKRFIFTSYDMDFRIDSPLSTIRHTNGIINIHEIMDNFMDICPTVQQNHRIGVVTTIVIKRLVQDYVNEFITAGILD